MQSIAALPGAGWRQFDEESIRAWRNHPEHVLAQQAGRDRWYESYSVQVAEISREYRVPRR